MSYSRDYRPSRQRHTYHDRDRPGEHGFTCRQCNQYVVCDPAIAGVQNRNHCPYCLWSRHLDWRTAGDRLAGCRASMRPIGLTTKRGRNKYAGERDGELMIIHRCTICEKVAINRIAADDSNATLVELFASSCAAGAVLAVELEPIGVSILTAHDSALVQRRLFGTMPIEQA